MSRTCEQGETAKDKAGKVGGFKSCKGLYVMGKI